MPKIKKGICFFSLLCLLCACSFHLRGKNPNGNAQPSIKKIYLVSETPYSDFMMTLKNTLRVRNIDVVDTAKEAEITLKILSLHFSKHNLSAVENQRSASYRFIYHIEYQLLTRDLHPLAPVQMLNSIRIDTTSTEAYSQSDTERLLKNELEENLAFNLINQATSKKTFDLLQTTPQNESLHPRY